MRAKKILNASAPTPEQIQACVSILEALRPEFDAIEKQAEIQYDALESLTNRFTSTVVDMYGHNSQPAERYENWRAYHMSSYNQRDSPETRRRQIQKDYRDGLKRTITELISVVQQLQLKLQHAGVTKMSASTEIQLVIQLCNRLSHSAKVLNRRRANKNPFEITDEYDVQDLLKAVLRAYFKYSVSEDPISKVAGVSSRADFAIEELGVIIEAKYVHNPGEQSRIVKEFAEDLLFYSKCPFLEHFVYLVYGADDLNEPELLDKLEGVKELNDKRFRAYIVRCPK